MEEEKKEPLTWEQVVEGLYGFKPERKEYGPEELAQFWAKIDAYDRQKAEQQAQEAKSGPKDMS